jgi:hypothetical protein
LDVMRCWCPTVSAVVRCRRRIERADSGLHKPNWYRLSSRVATCNVLRTGWVARASDVAWNQSACGAGTTTKQLISTAIFYGAIFVFVFGINRRFVIYCARTRGRSSSDAPPPPRIARNEHTKTSPLRCPRSGAAASTAGRLASSSRPRPPPRPRVYGYALRLLLPQTHTVSVCAREGVAGRGSRQAGV